MLPSDNNCLLLFAIFLAVFTHWYSVHNRHKTKDAFSVEQAVVNSWNKIIQFPTFQFKKVVVGINCNVDCIVSGTSVLSSLNVSASTGKDHESLRSLQEVEEAFTHFFTRGASAERYISEPKVFDELANAAQTLPKHEVEYAIGGNAALMATKIASFYTRAQVLLVGPIGPRSKALLHPQVITNNSTKIAKDELHMIMEYKQGEIWGEYVAPSSSRFITSHDLFSSSAVAIDMFFNTIVTFKPDLIILSGVHLLEFQPKELWQEKLRVIKRNLGQLSRSIPIHLEIGSMADHEFGKNVLYRIIPFVDSMGLNEQELAFLCALGEGPYKDQYPVRGGIIHVYKATEMLHWLIKKFGPDDTDPSGKQVNYRLQRIHFHCLTYHMTVSAGNDWSNLASGLAAGSRLAGRQACDMLSHDEDSSQLEMRTGSSFLLDKEQGRVYRFQAHNPLTSWMRQETLFIFTPVLVCKNPVKTVGLGDAISSTGLVYSQFYRFGDRKM